jgi:asparagine synthase (glutamine-hydrolysing)
VPVGAWFRGAGLRELFSDVLLSTRTRQRGYFEPRFIERLVDEHVTGRREHTLRLWSLLVFELWHRQYIDSREPVLERFRAAAPAAS